MQKNGLLTGTISITIQIKIHLQFVLLIVNMDSQLMFGIEISVLD